MQIMKGHTRDLGGGLQVNRVLPGFPHQMVGPPGETEFISLPEH